MGEGLSYLVESVTPSHNSTITDTPTFTVVFKEYMDASSLNTTTIKLIAGNGAPVPLNYSYSGVNRTLTITPDTTLEAGLYNLTILHGEDGIKTAMGEFSKTAYSYYYSVEKERSEDAIEAEAPIETMNTETLPEEDEEDEFQGTIEGLFLIDSYPSSGDVRNPGEPVILVFSEAIASSELVGQVTVEKKPLHPLLAGRGGDGTITLTPESNPSSTTHVLLLPEELEEGIEAELILSPELMDSERIRIPFQQNWERLYADTKDVRLILGLFGQAFTDAELTRMIHRESVSAYQVMSTRDSFVPEEWENQFPYAAGQYVIYRTAYQSILGQILESGSGMRKSISLGDLSVSESESTSRELKDLISMLKDEVDRWWRILNGIADHELDGIDIFTRTTGSATRSGNTSSYPDFIERVPFQELGG